jgi:chitin synthase
LAYVIGKFACKIVIQGFSFAFPVTLTVPLAVTLLISACGLRNEDPCIFQDTIPDYLYWECPDGDFLNDFISNQHAWIWFVYIFCLHYYLFTLFFVYIFCLHYLFTFFCRIVWLLSQTWIGIHIFMPHCERLAPTEKLFVTPMYLSLLIDQSLMLNRRRDDEGEVKTEELELDRVGLDENMNSNPGLT